MFYSASSALLHQFFTSYSVVFIGGGARKFLAPGRRVPLLRHWAQGHGYTTKILLASNTGFS